MLSALRWVMSAWRTGLQSAIATMPAGAWGMLLVFGAVHALISFPNHLLFRTSCLDLGLYAHGAFEYGTGHLATLDMFDRPGDPLLLAHFDLHLALFGPLTWLFGHWTLLIIQWLAVLWGGWGMYRFVDALNLGPRWPLVALVLFMGHFGVVSAMAFDYHSDVVSTCAVPWFLHAHATGRRTRSWLLLLFVLVGKENMGLWTMAIAACTATMTGFRTTRAHLIGQAVFSLAWSVVVIGWVLPALAPVDKPQPFGYFALGPHLGAVVLTVLQHPWEAFILLFTDPGSPAHDADPSKVEFWSFFLLSGGWAMLRKWRFLLMVLPILLQKMWHHGPVQWTAMAHYSVELAPICAWAIVHMASSFSARWAASTAMVLSLLGTLGTSIRRMDHPIAWDRLERVRFYHASHYERDAPTRATRQYLGDLPEGPVYCADTYLLPHLVRHEHVKLWPHHTLADRILLIERYDAGDGSLPRETLDTLNRSVHWRLRYSNGWLLDYERIGADVK